jgi:molybdopterin converting factor subunit 1
MTCTVRLFASLRDHAGAAHMTIAFEDRCDVATIRQRLKERLPAQLIDRCAIAVNHEYVPDDFAVRDGDEIAAIPPVSGG